MRIPKISKKEFWQRLKKRAFEDIEAIKVIEKFLIKKRGFIFKMPKPNTPVILLVSGGLDSTITWGLLMDKFKLKVYPLFFRRGINRWRKESKALDYFTNLYKKRYPQYFYPPLKISVNLPVPEFELLLKKKEFHPVFLLEFIKNINNLEELDILPQTVQPYLYPFLGLNYAAVLWQTKNIKINTVFSSVLPGDGTVVYSQTFTALRSTILSFCLATNNFNWQFASPVFEKEIGFWLEKSDLIKIGNYLNLPLEKTWSCYHEKKYQCGKCLTCYSRKLEFQKAGIIDKTSYQKEPVIAFYFKKLIQKTKKILKNLIFHFITCAFIFIFIFFSFG